MGRLLRMYLSSVACCAFSDVPIVGARMEFQGDVTLCFLGPRTQRILVAETADLEWGERGV